MTVKSAATMTAKELGDGVKGLAFLGVAGFLLYQCAFSGSHHEPPPASAPAAEKAEPKGPIALASMDEVDGVDIKRPTLTVSMMNKTFGGSADDYYLNVAALQAIRVGFQLQDGVIDDLHGVKAVNIILKTGMMDRLGNPVPAPIFMATYSMADIRAARIGTLGPVGFLNMARLVKVGPGPARRFISAWCIRNGDAGPFCTRALGSS